MSAAGSHIDATIRNLQQGYGACTPFGRSRRLFQFGGLFTCSINYSRELRGPKFFFGLSSEVVDPGAVFPATLHGHFVLLVCGGERSILWVPRALMLDAMRGVKSRRLDVFQEGGRFILQTTGHPKVDLSNCLNASPSPPPESSAQPQSPEKSRDHCEIQIGLAKLGRAEGCRVWVPAGDRNVRWRNEALAELTCERLPNFGFDESTRRVVSNIDVLWLQGNVIKRAFEIEATTSIYSGLLRLNDLVLAQPNNRIDLVIVADATKKSRVLGQMLRPTFSALSGQCDFVSFTDVRQAVNEVDRLKTQGVTHVRGLLRFENLVPSDHAIFSVTDLRS